MIIHVDMDAYYASVEVRDRPELASRPVIVGGSAEGRGVVAAANYVARQYGIHSAMPASTAKRLCPQAVFLPVRMEYYAQVSQQIRDIFHRYTPLVEPLSLDEAFLDVAGSKRLFGTAEEIGARVKREIADELRLVASVGVAPNKFLAKIASDLCKPDGFVVVDPDGIQEFLDPLPIGRLWGVGKVTGDVFKRHGIHTIGQLRRQPQEWLAQTFGKAGEHLWQLAHGIDDRAVVPDYQAKSISHETTFDVDIADFELLRSWLRALTEQVAYRLRRNQLRGRTVFIKVRYADFHTVTRSHTLTSATDVTSEIWRAAANLLSARLPVKKTAIRLIGVGVSGLGEEGDMQGDLFDQTASEKQQNVDAVSDRIRERFGSSAVKRGGLPKDTT